MKKHVIEQGEGLSKLAERYGFAPDTIWNLGANTALKQLRKDGNILLPGDELWIPDKKEKLVSVATGARHRFKKVGVPAKFRVQLLKNDTPRRRLPCTLEIEGGPTLSAVTDDEGVFEVFIPPKADRGRFFAGADPGVDVQFGSLDPITEPSGLQKRLLNLGFYRGACDGADDSATRAAVAAFQRRCGLDATGVADPATRDRLAEIHDGKALFPPASE